MIHLKILSLLSDKNAFSAIAYVKRPIRLRNRVDNYTLFCHHYLTTSRSGATQRIYLPLALILSSNATYETFKKHVSHYFTNCKCKFVLLKEEDDYVDRTCFIMGALELLCKISTLLILFFA